MDTNEPIPIRAHHIEVALDISLLPLKIAHLILGGAGYNPRFIDSFYDDAKRLFSNPEQRFLIILDQPDFICNHCKRFSDKYKEDGCFLSGDEKATFLRTKARSIVGAFSEGIESCMNNDKSAAEDYDLKAGQVYSVRELRERMEALE